MKYFTIALIGFLSLNLSAQEAEETAVREIIEHFFIGFHKQDSMLIKQTVSKGIILQTIFKDSLGRATVRTEDFSIFLKSIASVPKSTEFQEIIKGYSIQVDGPMANAWTSYVFMVNGRLSHCGVNSFQLLKEIDGWKVIYLIDTRRNNNCD